MHKEVSVYIVFFFTSRLTNIFSYCGKNLSISILHFNQMFPINEQSKQSYGVTRNEFKL